MYREDSTALREQICTKAYDQGRTVARIRKQRAAYNQIIQGLHCRINIAKQRVIKQCHDDLDASWDSIAKIRAYQQSIQDAKDLLAWCKPEPIAQPVPRSRMETEYAKDIGALYRMSNMMPQNAHFNSKLLAAYEHFCIGTIHPKIGGDHAMIYTLAIIAPSNKCCWTCDNHPVDQVDRNAFLAVQSKLKHPRIAIIQMLPLEGRPGYTICPTHIGKIVIVFGGRIQQQEGGQKYSASNIIAFGEPQQMREVEKKEKYVGVLKDPGSYKLSRRPIRMPGFLLANDPCNGNETVFQYKTTVRHLASLSGFVIPLEWDKLPQLSKLLKDRPPTAKPIKELHGVSKHVPTCCSSAIRLACNSRLQGFALSPGTCCPANHLEVESYRLLKPSHTTSFVASSMSAAQDFFTRSCGLGCG